MNFDLLVDDLTKEFNITREALMSKDRSGAVANARMVLYKVLYMSGKTITQIGKKLHRDHTTVSVQMRKILADKKLFDLAMELYTKHRENPCKDYEIEQKVAQRIIYDKVKEGINEGKMLESIAKDIGMNEKVIKKIAKTVFLKSKQKKIPDYKNGGYRVIYE